MFGELGYCIRYPRLIWAPSFVGMFQGVTVSHGSPSWIGMIRKLDKTAACKEIPKKRHTRWNEVGRALSAVYKLYKPLPFLFPNSHAMGSCKTKRGASSGHWQIWWADGVPVLFWWCPGFVVMVSRFLSWGTLTQASFSQGLSHRWLCLHLKRPLHSPLWLQHAFWGNNTWSVDIVSKVGSGQIGWLGRRIWSGWVADMLGSNIMSRTSKRKRSQVGGLELFSPRWTVANEILSTGLAWACEGLQGDTKKPTALLATPELPFSAWKTLAGMHVGWGLIFSVEGIGGVGVGWGANDVGLDVFRRWCRMLTSFGRCCWRFCQGWFLLKLFSISSLECETRCSWNSVFYKTPSPFFHPPQAGSVFNFCFSGGMLFS